MIRSKKRVPKKNTLREIEDAWGKESAKRLAEYEAGQAETISADEAGKQIQLIFKKQNS